MNKKECVYASASMNYIKRRHRAYLWMFRAFPSVNIDNETGTVTIVWGKYAFGKVFIMGEEIRKFEDEETDKTLIYEPTVENVLKAIKLHQFKKFATDNDILWFYNKPKWNTKLMKKRPDYLKELRKTWLEGNWHEAQFGTPEEREKEKKILQNKKRE